MIHNKMAKVVSLLLCAVMLLGTFPITAFAAWEDENVVFEGTKFGTNDYYNVISKKDYVLVPGAATETEMVLNNADGTRRQVLHIIEVDPSNPDVSIVPGYYNIDKDITDVANQQAAKLTDMAAYYEDTLGYNIVGGMNTDLYYAANAPRVLVYNGQDMRDYGSTQSVLCVYQAEDGTISVDVKAYSAATMDDELANGHAEKGKLLHAVGVSFAMTVKDGELVNKTEERTSSAAARSMVGVKEDGTLVICMNDGRGANNSVGFCSYELGESMLALGCKWAANCDGGGSSTFISKRVGEEDFTMRSVPCDGAERPTIHGIFVASNVAPTGELDYAEVEADYDYFAPGSSYTFVAKGIDTHGYEMDIPEDATWALSDASFGTIVGGTFVSNGKLGEVEIQVLSGGNVIGTRTITVANPTTLNLGATSTVVPYSTADKVRTISLPIVAMIGEANVYYDANCFEITLSDATAGTLDGFNFTATTDESVAGVEITVKYLPDETVMTYTVEFGKGSEVIWSFDDNIDGWLGNDKVSDWLVANGLPALTESSYGKNYSVDVITSTFLSTSENGGKVHNGTGALGMEIDRTKTDYNSWAYSLLFNVNEQIVLRDVANGQKATTLGMWMYVPEDFYTTRNNAAVAIQLTVYVGTDAAAAKGTQIHFQYNGKNINTLTEADIPENRWIYVTANISGYNYVALMDPTGTSYREPSFLRMYIKPSEAAKYSIYFDDITLDYSSAVDDREPPVISDVTYCVTDTNIALDGNTIDSNVISFNANVADYVKSNAEGLDYTSAKIYIDGIAVSGVKAANGAMSLENAVLSNGVHKVTFEIADKLGNATQVTKSFTVEADNASPAVTFGGHNDLGNVPQYDSVYYLDLTAADISKINSVTTEIELHTSSTWVLDQMILAEGFTATYSYNDISKIATITITKTGNCTLTGEQILASIPTRVWSWDAYTGTTGPVVNVEAKVVSGAIVYTDGKTGSFAGDLLVATAIDGNKATNAWHAHDAELTVLNKEATCTENGYTDRTYCETCGSVIDWGTTIPATGHEYVLTDGQFVCSECDDVLALGTGLIEIAGKGYYAIDGKLVSGWQLIDDSYYYFDETTFTAVESLYNGAVTYTFEASGKLTSGQWLHSAKGSVYYYGPSLYARTWATIDGEKYCFDRNGYCFKGLSHLTDGLNYDAVLYVFDEDGKFIKVYDEDYTGIIACSRGVYVYLVNGKVQRGAGLVKIDGEYYYIRSAGNAATGTYYVSNTNGIVPVGNYDFAADGKMINNPDNKNGMVKENGGIYYYVDNVLQKGAGLIVIDKAYYYVRSAGNVAIGRYYASRTNGLIIPGWYEFAEDGKMINSPADKNGMVSENGGIYYYIEGELQKGAGLVKVDGAYYYVRSGGNAAIGRYYASHTNGIITPGWYEFAEDGKMINAPADRNGMVSENGGIYYYVDNVLQKGAGLVKVDGAYYYVRSGGNAATGRYYASNTNGLIIPGWYEFAEDGKMIDPPEEKNGLVSENGGVFYYVDNVLQKGAGLVKIGNDYYYVRSGGNIATGTYYVSHTNGLVTAGRYEFAADGKLIDTSVIK